MGGNDSKWWERISKWWTLIFLGAISLFVGLITDNLKALTAGVILLGALLQWTMLSGIVLLFALATFLIVRPIVVALSLWGLRLSTTQAALISWFGVRGAGSVFYLAYAIGHGLEASHAAVVASVVLPTVALSVVVHGVSVTPFMLAYSRRRGNRPQHA